MDDLKLVILFSQCHDNKTVRDSISTALSNAVLLLDLRRRGGSTGKGWLPYWTEAGNQTWSDLHPECFSCMANINLTYVHWIKMQEKHERMKNLKSLRETETKLCERLCLPAHNLGDINVPNKEQLKELEANVQYLQKEQVRKTKQLNAINILWLLF